MKLVQTSIIAMVAFFLSTGISFGAELDDLEFTIRVVESDDLNEMHNELSLPAAASDTAREHAEDDDGRGLSRANEVREKEHEEDKSVDENEHHDSQDDVAGYDEREDEIEDHDNAHEDDDAVTQEHGEAHEEEEHEDEHEREDDNKSDGDADSGSAS